jgi:LacI family repressor for deo operon, udp, cdd, tsx, nupC, and nupG
MGLTTAAELYEELEREEAGQDPLPIEKRHGHCLAIVFTTPIIADENHTFTRPILQGIRGRAMELGCDVLTCVPSDDRWLTEEFIERCLNHGANGLIIFGVSDGNPDVLRGRWPELPVVFVESDTLGVRSARIAIDNEEAMGKAVVHLVELGRSRIAHIAGTLDVRVAADRLQAYRATLQRIGYPVRGDYIGAGEFTMKRSYEAARALLALDDPPDAIACACDASAVAAIKAIEDAGLNCPVDVAVTGFDDTPWAASLQPSLTTVRQPLQEMGVQATEDLVALIEDTDMTPPDRLLEAELIVRDSCGARSETARTELPVSK